MIYRIYGQKDSTIYENSTRKAQNTGLDEILEVSKIFSEDGNTFIGNSRILTKFDLLEISQSIQSGEIINSPKYKLNLTSTQASEVLSEYTLEVYPVSQSWNEGNGQYMDSPLNTNGNSWERRSVNSLWATDKASVFNGTSVKKVPTEGVVLYEGFANGTGSAFLTESINDFNGTIPTAFVENNQLVISASNFAGTTLVFPAYLQNSINYGVQFQICLLYTSPSPRDGLLSRMPSSA